MTSGNGALETRTICQRLTFCQQHMTSIWVLVDDGLSEIKNTNPKQRTLLNMSDMISVCEEC